MYTLRPRVLEPSNSLAEWPGASWVCLLETEYSSTAGGSAVLRVENDGFRTMVALLFGTWIAAVDTACFQRTVVVKKADQCVLKLQVYA